MSETYTRLAAHFDRHHKDPRGLDYLTGEQVVSRLNEVLGPGAWSFHVRDHGYDAEADEMWALGHLEATIDGQSTTREQFGSQKHNRLRSNGKIIDYGFDAKGAATDALKKCATLIGVGLYLAEKEGGVLQAAEADASNARPNSSQTRAARSTSGRAPVAASAVEAPSNVATAGASPAGYVPTDVRDVDDAPRCADCGAVIAGVAGRYTPADVIKRSRDAFGVAVCLGCGALRKAAMDEAKGAAA